MASLNYFEKHFFFTLMHYRFSPIVRRSIFSASHTKKKSKRSLPSVTSTECKVQTKHPDNLAKLLPAPLRQKLKNPLTNEEMINAVIKADGRMTSFEVMSAMRVLRKLPERLLADRKLLVQEAVDNLLSIFVNYHCYEAPIDALISILTSMDTFGYASSKREKEVTTIINVTIPLIINSKLNYDNLQSFSIISSFFPLNIIPFSFWKQVSVILAHCLQRNIHIDISITSRLLQSYIYYESHAPAYTETLPKLLQLLFLYIRRSLLLTGLPGDTISNTKSVLVTNKKTKDLMVAGSALARTCVAISNAAKKDWMGLKLLLDERFKQDFWNSLRHVTFQLKGETLCALLTFCIQWKLLELDNIDLHYEMPLPLFAAKHISEFGLAVNSSTLSETHCYLILSELRRLQQHHISADSTQNQIINPIDVMLDNVTPQAHNVFISVVEDNWIESIVCGRLKELIDIKIKKPEKNILNNNTKESNNRIIKLMTLLGNSGFVLRAQQLLFVNLLPFILRLFNLTASLFDILTLDEAHKKLEFGIFLLKLFLKLKLSPNDATLALLLPCVRSFKKKREDNGNDNDFTSVTAIGDAKQLSTLLLILAELQLPNYVDYFALMLRIEKLEMNVQDAIRLAVASKLFKATKCPQTMTEHSFENAFIYLQTSKLTEQQQHILDEFQCNADKNSRLSEKTFSYSINSSNLKIMLSPFIMPSDILQYHEKIMQRHALIPLVKLNEGNDIRPTLDKVMSVIGIRTQQQTTFLGDTHQLNNSYLTPENDLNSRLYKILNSIGPGEITIERDSLIENKIIPFKIQVSSLTKEREPDKKIRDLMEKDPVLWEILGDDQEMMACIDLGSTVNCNQKKFTYFIIPSSSTVQNFSVVTENLLKPQYTTQSIQFNLSEVSNIRPSSFHFYLQCLQGNDQAKVVIIDESQFIEAEIKGTSAAMKWVSNAIWQKE